MKKYLIIFLMLGFLFAVTDIKAETSLADKLQGIISLQVEEYGQAWYIYPKDKKRYYMGKPIDALSIIQKLGLGISNDNLNKIPVGIIDVGKLDTDGDGIDDELEKLIGTNLNKQDTDNDGYIDKIEVDSQYNPNGTGRIKVDENLVSRNLGLFLIQVENNGEAWYLYPKDKKRYYVGKPIDALRIMQKLGLGISNENLSKIDRYQETLINTKTKMSAHDVLRNVAEKVRRGQIEDALKYFTPEMGHRARYSLESFDDEHKLIFGNILSGATLYYNDDTMEKYTSKVYFSLGGYSSETEIILKKQDNGEWLISSI